MPRNNCTVNLPGFVVEKTSGYDPVTYHVVYRNKTRCIHCDSDKLRKKDTFIREIKHELIGQRRCRLRVKAHKFYCRDCHRYFNQRFPGIGKHQRATERLKEQLCRQHEHGICQTQLSKSFKVGTSTIER